MGKTQRALTSLVGAIPAGFLLYLLVMVFLNRSDRLSTMLMVFVGATLACAFLVVLMPFGILVMGGKKAEREAEKERPAKKGAKDQDSEELAVADEEEEAAVEEEGSSDFDIGESDAEIMSDSDDEISSGSASSLDEIETMDFDDEDEPPAKKKKK